jgi:hypothetical protein
MALADADMDTDSVDVVLELGEVTALEVVDLVPVEVTEVTDTALEVVDLVPVEVTVVLDADTVSEAAVSEAGVDMDSVDVVSVAMVVVASVAGEDTDLAVDTELVTDTPGDWDALPMFPLP